jgi:hypothetical protein
VGGSLRGEILVQDGDGPFVLDHQVVFRVDHLAAGAGRVWAPNWKGVWSKEGDAPWSLEPSGPMTAVFARGDDVWVAGQKGLIARLQAAGAWRRSEAGQGGEPHAIWVGDGEVLVGTQVMAMQP